MDIIASAIVLICVLFLLVPDIILLVLLWEYDLYSHQDILWLVVSNFVGFFPAAQSLYYTINKHYMVHEFMFFYLITLNSGTYHLCNKINYNENYCQYLSKEILIQLDYVNSYLCIIATILYLAKFEFMGDSFVKNVIKFTVHGIAYLLVTILTIKYRTSQLSALFTSFILIFVLIMFASYRFRYVELYFTFYRGCLFFIGFVFAIIAFVTYLYISIHSLHGEEKYWIYHSFLWHVPVLLSPVFIIESSTLSKNKMFFAWIRDIFLSSNNTIDGPPYNQTEQTDQNENTEEENQIEIV